MYLKTKCNYNIFYRRNKPDARNIHQFIHRFSAWHSKKPPTIHQVDRTVTKLNNHGYLPFLNPGSMPILLIMTKENSNCPHHSYWEYWMQGYLVGNRKQRLVV